MRGILALPGCRGKDSERGLYGQARPRARPRRRAGSRPRTPVARGDRALVAARDRLRCGRDHRPARLARRRQAVEGDGGGLSRPAAVRERGRRSRARRRASGSQPRTSTSWRRSSTPLMRPASRLAQLNGAISVKPILGLTGTKIGQPAPLMLLSVTGPKKVGVQIAAADARQARRERVPAVPGPEDQDHPGPPRPGAGPDRRHQCAAEGGRECPGCTDRVGGECRARGQLRAGHLDPVQPAIRLPERHHVGAGSRSHRRWASSRRGSSPTPRRRARAARAAARAS